MTAHAIAIDADNEAVDNNGARYAHASSRYRWRCSCGALGEWKPRVGRARSGGTKHAATMERGR